jgi:hypothetical protein
LPLKHCWGEGALPGNSVEAGTHRCGRALGGVVKHTSAAAVDGGNGVGVAGGGSKRDLHHQRIEGSTKRTQIDLKWPG